MSAGESQSLVKSEPMHEQSTQQSVPTVNTDITSCASQSPKRQKVLLFTLSGRIRKPVNRLGM